MRGYSFLGSVLLACAAATLLTGCLTTAAAPVHGNFSMLSEDQQSKLAADAAAQVAKAHPAAKVRLDFQHSTPDPFGIALVRNLRDRGFAVTEVPIPSKKKDKPENTEQEAQGAEPAAAPPGLPIRYVIDSMGTGLYRVSLLVGSGSMHRAYGVQARDSAMVPAGAWAQGASQGASK